MIDELDDALRDLLIRDMPIANNEVDIAFDQPTREWASRLSRPTLNLFMHDIRENNKLRTQQPYLGSTTNGMMATMSASPVRLDVHYMVTAWANDPGDEHRLLGRMLMVLYRYKALPEEFEYGSLGSQEYDILMKVAQYDQRDIRREIWSMLDNEMRPIVDLTLTLAIEPFAEWSVPLVRETQISFAQMDPFGLSTGSGGSGDNFNSNGMVIGDQFYSVAGMVHTPYPLDHLSVQLLELAVPVTVAPNGRYSIMNLRAGTYTLEVWTGQDAPTQHTIEVPSNPAEYDIYL
jgi:hypothetical protein